MTERAVRSLLLLENSASTARVLNLHRQWKLFGAGGDVDFRPFFQHPVLDRCFIIKHRLRRDETDFFSSPRQGATKIMVPIDPADLRLGARSFFIGQTQFQQTLRQIFGEDFCETRDYELLGVLDALPTVDPFLLREHLKRFGHRPDRRYFEVSNADLERMFSFVKAEVTPLVAMSFSDHEGGTADDGQVARLVSKILHATGDADLEPLRLTLRLARHEYEEGVFCWKGFLYYKWCLGEIIGHVQTVIDEISTLAPTGPLDLEAREQLDRSRVALRRAVQRACAVTRSTLQVYDDAYANLTRNGRPSAFREFLLDAPKLFSALGCRLGAVNHVVSFWRYRFPKGAPRQVSPEELMDIFTDFGTGLNFNEAADRELPAAA